MSKNLLAEKLKKVKQKICIKRPTYLQKNAMNFVQEQIIKVALPHLNKNH